MLSHNNPEREEPTKEVPTTDSESEVDEEEEMRKWLSTAYEDSSKAPMKKPLTAPLDVPISDSDLEKIKAGCKSKSMDDKWNLLVENPDEKGGISLHIIRSWLDEPCYILHIAPKSSSEDGGSAKVRGITWEGNKAGLQCDAEQAKKEAVILCRGHLRCEFEALPQYPSSAFWDRNAYKKIDAE
ncbi:hypothetical protein K445DRAFT_321304 [Daldinia sp. EC12]|nr:hypothetical protein K445DRAFT_321304 [Daldinia sp. EC12]